MFHFSNPPSVSLCQPGARSWRSSPQSGLSQLTFTTIFLLVDYKFILRAVEARDADTAIFVTRKGKRTGWPTSITSSVRRIASPDWLPIGGRCLTVIVTGSNYRGGSDGEETQRIGTSGADCGGSRPVFDQRAVCEAGDP